MVPKDNERLYRFVDAGPFCGLNDVVDVSIQPMKDFGQFGREASGFVLSMIGLDEVD